MIINYDADRNIVEKLCDERDFHNCIELHYVDNLRSGYAICTQYAL